MRNENECVFADEIDCPKDSVGLDCDECIKNKHYQVIENALNDFVSLGDAFTELFTLCNKIMKEHNGIELTIPRENINKIHRVMTAFLTTREQLNAEETLYRRLIFHFFSLIIDEFKADEYKEDAYLH